MEGIRGSAEVRNKALPPFYKRVPYFAVTSGLEKMKGDYGFRLGLVSISGESPVPEVVFCHTAADETDAGSYTFSSVPIGEAASDRLVVVSCHTTTNPVTAATIGGVTATVHATATNASKSTVLLSATVPTGTTADIVLTVGSALRMLIGVWTITHLNSATPTDTSTASSDDSLTSTSMSDLAINTGGVAIYAYTTNDAVLHRWSGAYESFDFRPPTEIANRASGAVGWAAGTVTVSHETSNGRALVGASWR